MVSAETMKKLVPKRLMKKLRSFGPCKKKVKEGDDEEEEFDLDDMPSGRCVISPNVMKLITLATLLLSDFDVMFTCCSVLCYHQSGGIFYLLNFTLLFAFCIYSGGCLFAAREATKFMERFKEKVRLNEIKGISMEDLTDALDGRRIFWMGIDYEHAKKRMSNVETIKLLMPSTVEDDELEIDAMNVALREAAIVGTSLLRMPGDPKYGDKVVKDAKRRLKAANRAQGRVPLDSGLSRGMSRALSRGASSLSGAAASGAVAEAPAADAEPEDSTIDVDDSVFDETVDYAAKIFEEEAEKARNDNAGNLVKMIELASIKQLDSWKVDEKLLDKKGKIKDPQKALYAICEIKGCLHAYHQASRTFSRRIVKMSHAMPYYRLFEFGWQPSVSHTDFAGIINANGLYSFTVGLPQFCFAIVFIVSSGNSGPRAPAPCETDAAIQCTIGEDFGRPSFQFVVVGTSCFVAALSLVLSITNIMVDFPAQLFDLSESEEAMLHITLQAEQATKAWEDKLSIEVSENVKAMLRLQTGGDVDENATIVGLRPPHQVIEDICALERRAIEKKVAYVEHYIKLTEDETAARLAMKAGNRANHEEEEEPPEEKKEKPMSKRAARILHPGASSADDDATDVTTLPPPAQLPPPEAAGPKDPTTATTTSAALLRARSRAPSGLPATVREESGADVAPVQPEPETEPPSFAEVDKADMGT